MRGEGGKLRLWVWLQTACCVQREQECGSGREWRCCDLLRDTLLFLTDTWTAPAIWWKYRVSTQWFITRSKQAQMQLGGKGDHKTLTTSRPCCWLHYDPVECEWAFKAVITLAVLVCVPPTFRPMWATSLTRGHFLTSRISVINYITGILGRGCCIMKERNIPLSQLLKSSTAFDVREALCGRQTRFPVFVEL